MEIFNLSTIATKKMSYKVTNFFIKDKMTERVFIVRRIFEKIARKLKLKSQYPKKHNFNQMLTKDDVFRVL